MSTADERIAKLLESGIAKLDDLGRRVEAIERQSKRARPSADVPAGQPPSGDSDSGGANGALGEAAHSASSAKGSASAVSAAPKPSAKRSPAAAGHRHPGGELSGSGEDAHSSEAEGRKAMEDGLGEEVSDGPVTFTCQNGWTRSASMICSPSPCRPRRRSTSGPQRTSASSR